MTAHHPVTEIAGSGHYPQLTHPAQVARHLRTATAPIDR
jgi:pimeloyl-ACP methyl ester carboxylesterase